MSSTPDGRHILLPGWTAYKWALVGLVFFGCTMLSTVLFIVVSRLSLISPLASQMVPWALGIDICLALSTGALQAISAIKSRLEISAGYVTATGTRRDVDLVEPTTGIVIRYAGSTDLLGADYKQSCREALERHASSLPSESVHHDQ